jgi:YD repeat-containing protein
MLYKFIIAVLCLGMVAAIEPVQEKVGSVEGKWERRQKDEGGESLRIVKEHKDGRTTVTAYDATGNVVSQHTSQYKLRKTNDVHVFSYSNIEVTEGPAKGQKAAGPFSYAYRISDDFFYEFRGVLLGDSATPALFVWARVKDK